MKTPHISVLAAAGIVSAAIAFAQAPPAIQPVMMKQLKPDVWAGLGGSGGNSTIYIGKTGVIVDNYRDMEEPEALELADSLDPVVIRKEVETRFSPEMMVSNYVAAYEATIEATG